MKRFSIVRETAVLTAAILAAGTALVGCGSSGTASTDTAAQAETAAADTEAAEETTEVRTIKAVTTASTRPYVYVDEDNDATGYDIEVLKAVFEQLPQYDLEFEITQFDGIFSGLTAGQYQIAVNNFSYSETRAESYLYSLPYDKISYVFVYKDGADPITTFADAAGKSTESESSVSIGTAIEKWNAENPDQAINIKYSEADTLLTLQHVLDGTNDFQIVDTAMFNAYDAEYGLDGLVAVQLSEEDAKAIAENDYAYYLFPFDEDELRNAVSEVLVQLQQDGTLTALGQEFQGRDDCAPEDAQMETLLN